jgi:hypothetical protein
MQHDMVVDWAFFRANWKRILLGMATGLAIAGLAFALVVPRWEASALIQIGKVGDAGGANATPIELTDNVAARLLLPAFVKTAVERAGHPDMLSPLLPKIYNGNGWLNVYMVNAETISVKLQAPSALLAQQLTEGVVAELMDEHARLMEPRVHFAQESLSALQRLVSQEEKTAEELAKRLAQTSGKQGMDDSVMPSLISNSSLGQDRYQTMLVVESLMEPVSRPTRMLGQVEVLGRPAFPRVSRFAALGVMIGFVLTGALLLNRREK